MISDEQLVEELRRATQDSVRQVAERCRLETPLTLRVTWDPEDARALSDYHGLDPNVELFHVLARELNLQLSKHLEVTSDLEEPTSLLPTPTLLMKRPSDGVVELTLARLQGS